MSRIFVCAALAVALIPSLGRADVIMLEDFEDNTVNYTISTGGEFYDTNHDYFTIVPLNGAVAPDDGPYTGFGGSNFFGAEDMDDSDGPGAGTQTLTFTINVSGFEDLRFSGLFAAGGNSTGGADGTIRYDDEDGIRVRATLDADPIQDLLAFEAVEPGGDTSNNELRQDADFNNVGDAAGFMPTAAFAAFNDIAISGTGNTLVLEIEVTSTANNESLAFDNISVSGTAIIPEPSSAILLMIGMVAVVFAGRKKLASKK